jgi:hypothetical protein
VVGWPYFRLEALFGAPEGLQDDGFKLFIHAAWRNPALVGTFFLEIYGCFNPIPLGANIKHRLHGSQTCVNSLLNHGFLGVFYIRGKRFLMFAVIHEKMKASCKIPFIQCWE